MPFYKNRIASALLIPALFLILLTSCNKDIPQATPLVYPSNNSETSIGAIINSDPKYSIFKAAASRVGALADLSDDNKTFTVFLPDDNAFIASGIPSAAAIATLPIATVGGIVNYAIVPGQQYTSANVSSNFPNVQLPAAITIGMLPGTPIPLKLSTFPSKKTNGFWDNNIPVVTPDLVFKNGIVHIVAGIVAPPSQVLRDALYNNPDLTYFKAALARADSGQTGLNRFDSLLNYAVTNMTVLAPSDVAFQDLLFKSIYGALVSLGLDPAIAAAQATALSSSPGVFNQPLLYGVLTAATIRGILAYHLLATPNAVSGAYEPNVRVFSVNFPPASATPYFVKTMVNSSFGPHPGIMANAGFTGPVVSDLKLTGVGTFPPGGAPFSGTPATVISKDNHAVNGVYHVIDQVLLPQ